MKVLIYDNDPIDLEKLSELLNCVPLDMEIVKINDPSTFKKIYEQDDFSVLFIDLNNGESTELLSFVRAIRPKQRVVVINNRLDCCLQEGCDLCQNKFNGFRIIKPIEILDIVDAFKRKECRFDCSDQLLLKLSIISKSIPFFKFDKESLRFYHDHTNFEHHIVDLVNRLQKFNINYEILDEHLQVVA